MLGKADPAATVAAFDLQVEGEPASRGVVYFVPARQVKWHPAGLHAELRRDGAGLVLELSASRLARAVWIDFGDIDAELSENALTLLPGERVLLRVNSAVNESTLRAALHIRSLADAVRTNKN